MGHGDIRVPVTNSGNRAVGAEIFGTPSGGYAASGSSSMNPPSPLDPHPGSVRGISEKEIWRDTYKWPSRKAARSHPRDDTANGLCAATTTLLSVAGRH